jgi:hypothetical protein
MKKFSEHTPLVVMVVLCYILLSVCMAADVDKVFKLPVQTCHP